MPLPVRLGVSLPVQEELTIADHLRLAKTAEEAGFDTVFAGEIAGAEVFAMLSLIADHTTRIRVGSGVVSIYTRTPVLAAMAYATLDAIAPGRIVAGLGTGSPTLVESWHGRELRRPRQTMTDFVRILRAVLTGRHVEDAGPELRTAGFRLQVPHPGRVPVYLGSFNPAMLRLAGAIADGVILAFCPPEQLAARVASVRDGAEEAGRDPADIEIAAYVSAYAGPDIDAAMMRFRKLVLQYAVQRTHRAGFAASFPRIDEATQLWHAGRRAQALDLVSVDTVRSVCAVGTAADVVEHLERVRAAGVDLPVLAPQSLRPGDADSPDRTVREVAKLCRALRSEVNR